MGDYTKDITDATFEHEVINAKGAVLVDFWAEWCGPCKMIAPTLEDIAREMVGQLTIAKVNVEENPKSPTNFGVRGIPTMILFKDGKPVGTKVGAVPKDKLKEWIKNSLG